MTNPTAAPAAEFTPTARMIIHTDWSIDHARSHHGASTGHVRVAAVLLATTTRRERTRVFAGTEAEAIDWTFEVLAAAGERGVATELRDARG